MQRTQKSRQNIEPKTQNQNMGFTFVFSDSLPSALSGSFVFFVSVFFQRKRSRGFTLIEALVALSIIALAVIGPLSLAATALSAARVARDQLTAYYLAQEGIETVRNVRDANRLGSGTAWTDGWFTACSSTDSSLECAVKIDGSKVNLSGRVTAISCSWPREDLTKAIEECLTKKSETVLWYDDRLSGGSGTERGLFGHDSNFHTETDFRRAVIMEKVQSDNETIQITSVVSWPTSFGRTRNVKLTEYLKNLQ